MIDVKITGKDFSTIHNALCELKSITKKLDGVVSDRISTRLNWTVDQFTKGLEDAQSQDLNSLHNKMEYWAKVGNREGFFTLWSIFDIDADCDKVHPYDDVKYLKYTTGNTQVVASVKGNTWLDLYRAANEAILLSKDSHHSFIEGFEPRGREPDCLTLITGS